MEAVVKRDNMLNSATETLKIFPGPMPNGTGEFVEPEGSEGEMPAKKEDFWKQNWFQVMVFAVSMAASWTYFYADNKVQAYQLHEAIGITKYLKAEYDSLKNRVDKHDASLNLYDEIVKSNKNAEQMNRNAEQMNKNMERMLNNLERRSGKRQ